MLRRRSGQKLGLQSLGSALGVALTFGSCSRQAAAADEDRWWGRDKALHFGVSAGLAVGGYAVSTLVLDEPYQRSLAGAGFALSLGIAKETYDYTAHGDASWKDLSWDVAGTALGIGLALAIDLALGSSRDRDASPSSAALPLRF